MRRRVESRFAAKLKILAMRDLVILPHDLRLPARANATARRTVSRVFTVSTVAAGTVARGVSVLHVAHAVVNLLRRKVHHIRVPVGY